ncbi:hypothetical protein GCM10010349_76890 [Streptomyces flavofungini]|nr:hypothetical protein GCM10010349_76890 [Streptomyces flavofungini]
MISRTEREPNAPPSAPSVHSERLPVGVNRRVGVDTPSGGGDCGAADHRPSLHDRVPSCTGANSGGKQAN